MPLSREDVEHIAILCRLGLSEEEAERMRDQLSHILEQFEVLQQLDTEGVLPMRHSVELENVLREDAPGPCLDREQVLANAPRRLQEFFRVNRVLEE